MSRPEMSRPEMSGDGRPTDSERWRARHAMEEMADEHESPVGRRYLTRMSSKGRRRRLQVILGTGLVVLAVVASLSIFGVWPRVGAAILSRTGSTETKTTVVLD